METSVPAESPPRLHSPIPEVEWKVQTSFPKARSPGPTSAVGEVLDGDHWSAFNRAVSNVLATEVAEFVLAQLIDGLPVGDVARKSVGWLSRDHPIREHTTLCDGVLERTKAWIAKFSPSVLKMEDRLLQAFRSTTPNTRHFNLRLLELTAVAIHQVAVSLFKLDEKLHDGDIASITSWQEPLRTRTWEDHRGKLRAEEIMRPPVHPTLFINIWYSDHAQYPFGVDDIAGYWAEDWIFGGVVLFDRGESDDECKDVYLHSGRDGVTKRVWKILDDQETALFEFLGSEVPGNIPCPLPLPCEKTNLMRHDPWDAMALHHIYRDPWERTETPRKDYDGEYGRKTLLDYPEMVEGSMVS